MKRAALIVFQVALAVLVGLAARELWVARSGDAAPRERSVDTVSVAASVRPSVHTFGQPIVATVEVVADATLVKPKTIRIDEDFAPYELAGEPTVERKVVDGVARVVFRYPLRCLAEGCDPAEERGVAEFETGFVLYRFVQGSGPGRDLIPWPPIQVASRVADAEVSDIRWRASRTALPAVTTRFGPVGLAAALMAAALALAAVAVWLAFRLWHVAKVVEEVTVDTRTPLERALDLVLDASSNGASQAERRRVLERLARELHTSGLVALAEDARELAWSPRVSSSDDVSDLVRRAAAAAGVGGRE